MCQSGERELANIFIVMITATAIQMVQGIAMGYYLISTTTVSEFIASMEKFRIPRNIIIHFSVMFCFFPAIAEEAGFISDAMRMRGVSFGSHNLWQNPLSMIEYRMIPHYHEESLNGTITLNNTNAMDLPIHKTAKQHFHDVSAVSKKNTAVLLKWRADIIQPHND